MKKRTIPPGVETLPFLAAAIILAALGLAPGPSVSLLPWEGVGGCGVSGGAASGGSAAGAKWIGRGVTGGLLDAEALYNSTIGEDYHYRTLSPRLSYQFLNDNTAGISLPFLMKNGSYLYDKNEPTVTQSVGGFGDMGLDYTRKFGNTGALGVTLGLGLPTGKYNHRRYNSLYSPLSGVAEKELVVPELQAGTGLYSSTLSAEYTIDRDFGPVIITGSYTAMFSSLSNLFDVKRGWGSQNDVWKGRIVEYGLDDALTYTMRYGAWHEISQPEFPANPSDSAAMAQYQRDMDVWGAEREITKAYYVRDKNNAKGDALRGDFYGDVLGVHIGAGYKQENCVHSMAVSYSYKIAADWYIRRIDPGAGANTVKRREEYREEIYLLPVSRDRNRHGWGLAYGNEISSLYFPVFIAGTVSLDGRGGVQGFGGTLGIRGSFF